MLRRGARSSCLTMLAVAAALAGCTAHPSPEGPEAHDRPVVVAVLDSGSNPYHELFRAAAGGDDVDAFRPFFASLENPPEFVSLSTNGTYEERRQADDDVWSGLESHKLYAFSGTRLLGISFSPLGGRSIIEDATLGHGTGTSGLVARSSPRAIIVMISISDESCTSEGRMDCFIDPSTAQGMLWAAEQPWIDVISVSIAFPANVPNREELHPEARVYLDASRRAAENGKLVVNAAGNTVAPGTFSYWNGPPWILTVGGFEPNPRGESIPAGKHPAVVANFTEYIPYAGSLDGYGWSEGTSFATPIVAGTLAEAIALSRETPLLATAGGAPLSHFADALNLSALHFTPTDWDPTRPAAPNDTISTALGASLPVVAPAQQMGWGYVHGGLAPEVARRVLEGDFALPPEKAETEAWMRAVMAARQAYWDRVGG